MTKLTISLSLYMISFILFSQQNDSNKIINAVTSGNLEIVGYMLDKGMDPNTQNKQMKSLLYLATELSNLEMIDLLLKKGALVDFPFDKERTKEQEGMDVIDPTPLLYAGAHGQAKIIERLIQEDPNLEIRNHYGGNALIPAAEKGHYETAKVLLEKTDIDIDFINYLGWTALLEVVILSKNKDMQVKMAKLLLDHHAGVSIKDKDGIDALTHAKRNKHKELVELLESY